MSMVTGMLIDKYLSFEECIHTENKSFCVNAHSLKCNGMEYEFHVKSGCALRAIGGLNMRNGLVIICVLALLLCGCSNGENRIINSGGDYSAILDSLPETLSITTSIPDNYPPSLTTYETAFFYPSEEKMIAHFVQDEVISTTQNATGSTFYSENEYLIISKNSGDANGGLLSDLQGSPSMNPSFVRPFLFEIPSGWLSFFGEEYLLYPNTICNDINEDSLAMITKNLLDELDYPLTGFYQSEYYSKEFMQSNQSVWNSFVDRRNIISKKNIGEEFWTSDSTMITEQDEYSMVRFRQYIDGIPISVSMWDLDHSAFLPLATFKYNREGTLLMFMIWDMVDIGASIGTAAVISPAEALRIYIKDYSSAVHFSPTIIYDMQLEYVILKNSEKMIARPVWTINLKTLTDELPDSYYIGRDWEVYSYSSVLVTADTGVILSSIRDFR